jgi:hypothetical protein
MDGLILSEFFNAVRNDSYINIISNTGKINDGETNKVETNTGKINDGETNKVETNKVETNDGETNKVETNHDTEYSFLYEMIVVNFFII